jgi:hypothetical protein
MLRHRSVVLGDALGRPGKVAGNFEALKRRPALMERGAVFLLDFLLGEMPV